MFCLLILVLLSIPVVGIKKKEFLFSHIGESFMTKLYFQRKSFCIHWKLSFIRSSALILERVRGPEARILAVGPASFSYCMPNGPALIFTIDFPSIYISILFSFSISLFFLSFFFLSLFFLSFFFFLFVFF